MEISFATQRLQRLCESAKQLQRALGRPCARKVMTRLKDLAAAPTLEEFRQLPGRCHELAGDRKGHLAIDLAGGKRLLLRPTQNPAPRKQDGGLEWREVDAIEVTEIVDYHD